AEAQKRVEIDKNRGPFIASSSHSYSIQAVYRFNGVLTAGRSEHRKPPNGSLPDSNLPWARLCREVENRIPVIDLRGFVSAPLLVGQVHIAARVRCTTFVVVYRPKDRVDKQGPIRIFDELNPVYVVCVWIRAFNIVLNEHGGTEVWLLVWTRWVVFWVVTH